MNERFARLVRERADGRCEYCRVPQSAYRTPFEIDHVIARQHGGPTTLGNLTLSCLHCNSHKGPNIAGQDPRTRRLVRLFNPRRSRWARHFRWDGAVLIGRTPVGRATIRVLTMNAAAAVAVRSVLIDVNELTDE